MAVNRYYSSTAQKTTLNGAITTSATSIVVNATTGFPVSFPYTLILERDTVDEEVVKVTAASGFTLTVARGQDGTAGIAHNNGAVVEHGVSAQDYTEPQAHIAATSAVHGLTGPPAGTTDAQTLTSKTLALGSNTVSGTTAQFNAALSDNDFATLAGIETLTNKTLTSPTTTSGTADAASTIGGVSGTSLAADRTVWASYTPTFVNCTSPAGNFYYKQIGKTLHVRGAFTGGTVTANAVCSITLPAGLTAAATGDQACQGQIGNRTVYVPAGGTTIVTTTAVTASVSLTTAAGTSLFAVMEVA